MWRLTRAWPSLFVVLVLASGCGRGSPTSPSWTSSLRQCDLGTSGALTATIDGTPWIPGSTLAYAGDVIRASDCTYLLNITFARFRGVGTYDVAAGDVWAGFGCDGRFCGTWGANASTVSGKTTVEGSGSVTVTAYAAPTPGVTGTGSGAIEGTFSFTLAPDLGMNPPGATGTKVITNGRFGARFVGIGFSKHPTSNAPG